ncbi:hypothetical protein MCAMS1_02152 [biofilm metagenome]
MQFKTVLSITISILTLLYPLAVYFGIQYLQPWNIAALLVVILALRLLITSGARQWGRPLIFIGIAYCTFAAWRNEVDALRLYPVLVSVGMLLLFAWSLYSPPTIIERLARLQHPNLPPEGVVYTRRVTQIWCLFFIINGGIALFTALYSSLATWSLYNGLIAYVLMGILFAGEYIVRKRTQPHAR